MKDIAKPAAEPISAAFAKHYSEAFAAHGATAKGVNWGPSTDPVLRHRKFLELIEQDPNADKPPSLLDVGCGYGGLLAHAKERGILLDYTGIDLVPAMVAHARETHPDAKFEIGDVLSLPDAKKFDYAVCSGILTNNFGPSILDMDEFAKRLIRRMFSLVTRGIAFNTMSTYVDYMAPTGYHKSPLEMMAFCASELSPRLRLDHAYAAFEYIVYVYRSDRGRAAA